MGERSPKRDRSPKKESKEDKKEEKKDSKKEKKDSKKEKPIDPAYLPGDVACSICKKTSDKQTHGLVCRRKKKNDILGCGEGVCWSCMESAPRSVLGMVRTTKEEFTALDDAWWMHEKCMESRDLRSYYGGEKELQQARTAT